MYIYIYIFIYILLHIKNYYIIQFLRLILKPSKASVYPQQFKIKQAIL